MVTQLTADLAAANARIDALEAAPAPAPDTTNSTTSSATWLTLAALAAGVGGLVLGGLAYRRRS